MGTISQLTFMLHIENTSVLDNHKGYLQFNSENNNHRNNQFKNYSKLCI